MTVRTITHKVSETFKQRVLKGSVKWIVAAASFTVLAGSASMEAYTADVPTEAPSQEMIVKVAGKTTAIPKLKIPAKGRVSSPFGYRIHPIYKTRKFHAGIDIAGSGPIVSAQSGKVTRVRYDKGWGWYVKIDHGNGLQTLYAHMKTGSLKVKEGQKVKAGQQIGTMGTTGASTGVHLHFEVYLNNKQVNPAPYIGLK
ncbi:M23 family metallopeptidase [Atopococcus tabaci]|uniref:M23 family metallopeptidase n=1 Tax=Atopococcus tabaci TaxID=269774 RepID=UPI00040CEA3C|nr:M23 family metallopeptidase [Atopococcus tabaci]